MKKIGDLEGEVHEIRLDLDTGAARQLAELDLLLAVRRAQEGKLGATWSSPAPGR